MLEFFASPRLRPFLLLAALCAAAAPAAAHPFDEGVPRAAVVWSEADARREGPSGPVVDLRIGLVFLHQQPFTATLRRATVDFVASTSLIEAGRRFGFAVERTLLSLSIASGETRLFAPPDAWVAIDGAPTAALDSGAFELALDWGYATGHVIVRLTPTALEVVRGHGGKP